MAATTIVIRVNRSPALVPNALWPPMPPKAPVNPPPRPRWTRITSIRKMESSDSGDAEAVSQVSARLLNSVREHAHTFGRSRSIYGTVTAQAAGDDAPRSCRPSASLRRPGPRRCWAGRASSPAFSASRCRRIESARLPATGGIVAVGQQLAKVSMDLFGLLRAWRLCRCRWPKPARRRSRSCRICSADRPASEPSNCSRMTAAVWPASRSASSLADADDRASARRPGRRGPS